MMPIFADIATYGLELERKGLKFQSFSLFKLKRHAIQFLQEGHPFQDLRICPPCLYR